MSDHDANQRTIDRYSIQVGALSPHRDSMREAPAHASRRASLRGRAPGRAPVCQCGGQCRTCSPVARSSGMSGELTRDETEAVTMRKALTRAHHHEAMTSKAPAIVKRASDGTETVVRSAHKSREQVRRTRIARRAVIEAREFRRATSEGPTMRLHVER